MLNLKIKAETESFATVEYGTFGWPIKYFDTAQNLNEKYNYATINLRIDDNIKPILFLENTDLLEQNNNSVFIDENKLLNGTATDWSKDITLKFPNTGTATKNNIAYYMKLQYFRQVGTDTINLNGVFASIDTPNLGNTDYKFQQVSSEHFSFIEGTLQNALSFSGLAVAGAHFDDKRVVFHTRMLFPKKTTGEFYATTTAEINEGLSLEGDFNEMSFLKKDMYSYVQSIQENANSERIKILDIATYKKSPHREEDLFILGLMQSELTALKNVTGLSNQHARYIGFEDVSPNPAEDSNGIPYKKYKLNVQGLDFLGVPAVVYPFPDIFVFTTRGFVFCSKDFSDAEPKEDNIEYIYYTKEGYYLGGNEISNKVYIVTQQEYDFAKESQKWFVINREKNILKEKNVPISHVEFVKKSSTVYGESSAAYNIIEKFEFYAIASVHKRNKVAYGVDSAYAKIFRKTSCQNRNNNIAMKFSIAAEINALLDGIDYSNGAKQWDGAEQTHLPIKNLDILSNGKFMFKVNVMGWKISDEYYNSWKNAVSGKFGVNYFNAPQIKYAVANYNKMTNKDKIRLQSVAQYGLTMFWKEVNISKP